MYIFLKGEREGDEDERVNAGMGEETTDDEMRRIPHSVGGRDGINKVRTRLEGP
jgi:hypothetical protein